MSTSLILLILASHWFADFVCQPRWMGVNKSHDMEALISHVSVYTIMMLPVLVYAAVSLNIIIGEASNAGGAAIILVTSCFFLHLLVDFLTSKINAQLFKNRAWYEFWTMIGFDQLLHYICLFGMIAVLR